jgi:hypothetical protein
VGKRVSEKSERFYKEGIKVEDPRFFELFEG